MRSILFVDDEPRVLEGLENALFRHRSEWQMTFCDDPRVALAAVERNPFDVVVSDMRMPHLDGAQLLTRIQEIRPRVVRVVLSAHAEFEATLRAVPVAHHYLIKPCDAEALWDTVQRACRLQQHLDDGQLRRVVERARDLPPAPSTYVQLTRVLADPGAAVEDCAEIIERDVALSASVIRLANSAALGHGRAATIRQAAVFLGTNMLRNLVLSAETFGAFQSRIAPAALAAEQQHAVLTAGIAKALAGDRYVGENAYLAGILHDVGGLLLASQLPAEAARARAAARHAKELDYVAERRTMGTTHAGVGAWILSSWGLSYPVVEAVAFHHEPRLVPHDRLDVLGLVHVADALASEIDGTNRHSIDAEYARRLGIEDQLPEWRERAAALSCTLAS